MAGTGWDSSTAPASVTIAGDGSAERDATGGASEGVRGNAGRNKGKRYFEIEATDASCAIGVVSESADLDNQLGAGDDPLQWGFLLSDGYFYHRESGSSGSTDKGTGAVAIGTIGVLVDFDSKSLTFYADGVELFTQSVSFANDTVLYPAVSLGQSVTGVELQTVEPFAYPPAVTYIAWDKPDSALASRVSGTMKINDVPVARMLKAFSYERLTYTLNGSAITESKPLGQTISADTGEYEIILRDGFSGDVFVVAFDDYGVDFEGGASVEVGDRIHASTHNGYVYECNGAGVLPATEPVWSNDTETGQSVGTASFLAHVFWRPEVQGPLAPEITSIIFNPDYLFEGGGKGALYDPSDMSTLFQDENGLVPVTSDGDPVGLMLDASGNGNHVSQSNNSKRPTFRESNKFRWLQFDAGERLERPALDILSNDVLVSACASITQSVEYGIIFSTSTTSNRVTFFYDSGTSKTLVLESSGGDKTINFATQLGRGVPAILTFERESLVYTGRVNGVATSSMEAPAIATNNYFYIGFQAAGQLTFSGNLYGMALCERQDDYMRGELESWLAGKAP